MWYSSMLQMKPCDLILVSQFLLVSARKCGIASCFSASGWQRIRGFLSTVIIVCLHNFFCIVLLAFILAQSFPSVHC